jgi:protein-L-isoaspartate(D-aspartate) O-methyltransferase
MQTDPSAMTDQAAARRNMVESQLKPNRVTDERVLDAMGSVARERFVPAHLSRVAYVDEDLEIAPERHLIEPRVLGRLLNEAALRPGERVLDVGAGTGYVTAVLATMGAEVVALEADPALAAATRANLGALGLGNIEVVEGELAKGAPAKAPFDVVLVAGAIAEVPDALSSQVAENGRLVAVVGEGPVGVATLFTRVAGTMSGRPLFDAGTPALPGFAREPGFVF